MRLKPLAEREMDSIDWLSHFLMGRFGGKEESILRMQELKQALIAAMDPGDPEPDEKTWAAADRRANQLLARYTTIPALERDDEGYGRVEQRVIIRHDFDLDWLEAQAVQKVIFLANEGILHQLITCGHCKALFLPARLGQANCSASCSKKAYESDANFRAKRNEWARENYRVTKKRNALALAATKTKTK